MKLSKRHTLAILTTSLVAFLAASSSSQAASITWGAATNISGNADVSTNGTLVGAFNVGDTGVSTTTVNGVQFNGLAAAIATNSVTSGNFTLAVQPNSDIFLSDNTFAGSASGPFNTLTSEYKTLLAAAAITAQPSNMVLTMSGLIVGQTYQFQWWANFSGFNNTSTLHSATAGNSVTLNDNLTNSEGGLGQFVIGTFVADATSQAVTFSPVPPSDANSAAQVNAFQLRAVASVPETASLLAGMLPLGVLLLGRFCRRGAVATGKV